MTKRVMLPQPEHVEQFHVVDRGTHLELVYLKVTPEFQGCGLGSQCIVQLQSLNRPIKLVASPEPGKEAALLRFYQDHDFRQTFNPEVPNEMEWLP